MERGELLPRRGEMGERTTDPWPVATCRSMGLIGGRDADDINVDPPPLLLVSADRPFSGGLLPVEPTESAASVASGNLIIEAGFVDHILPPPAEGSQSADRPVSGGDVWVDPVPADPVPSSELPAPGSAPRLRLVEGYADRNGPTQAQ